VSADLIEFLRARLDDDQRAASEYDPTVRPRPMREVVVKQLIFGLHRECDERCYIVRVLVLPYADHLDYRPEWAPQ
jgi:hypothetical protein